MIARKLLAVSAALVMGAAGLTACSGDDGGGGGGESGDVAMTFWHNATTGDGKAFWEKTVADFQAANPEVKIEIQSIQNEDLDGKLQTALNSGDAPDVFLQRGGGKMAAMVEAGQLMDITGSITRRDQGGISAGCSRRRRSTARSTRCRSRYCPVGSSTARTCSPRRASPRHRPRWTSSGRGRQAQGAGSQPIALGAKDAWPAATGTTSSRCASAAPRPSPRPPSRCPSTTPAG